MSNDATHGVQVNLLPRDDFRRSIIWTPTTRLEEITVRHQIGQSKIANFDIVVTVEKQATGVGQLPFVLTGNPGKEPNEEGFAAHFSGLRSRWTIWCL